jgi:hypothetical protein
LTFALPLLFIEEQFPLGDAVGVADERRYRQFLRGGARGVRIRFRPAACDRRLPLRAGQHGCFGQYVHNFSFVAASRESAANFRSVTRVLTNAATSVKVFVLG